MPQLAPMQISVINASTVLTDNEVSPVVNALQQQVTNDFLPAWGVDAELTFIPTGSTPPAGTWWLTILDDSDQAGALGYHDLTPDGLPIGKVFAGTDLKYGTQWTVTASHELLEMLADPNINLTVFVQNEQNTGVLYAYEVCDACETDNLGYKVDNILVSDFVFPSWFENFRTPGSTQFDQDQTDPKSLAIASRRLHWDVRCQLGQRLAATNCSEAAQHAQPRERGQSPRASAHRAAGVDAKQPPQGNHASRRALPATRAAYSDAASGSVKHKLPS